MPRRPPPGERLSDRICAHLQAHPQESFTTRDMADAIGIPFASTSATISSYLPIMPISPAGMRPVAPGGKGGQPATLYRYDPTKPLGRRKTRRKKPAKAKSKELVPVAVNGTAVQTRQVRVKPAEDVFAKVIHVDPRFVVLITHDGEIIKGKVLHE